MATDLKPGPALDREVAAAIGWEFTKTYGGADCATCSCEIVVCNAFEVGDGTMRARYPSTDVGDAVAALEATGQAFMVSRERPEEVEPSDLWCVEFGRGTQWLTRAHFASTLPEAACRAILAWKEAQQDG